MTALESENQEAARTSIIRLGTRKNLTCQHATDRNEITVALAEDMHLPASKEDRMLLRASLFGVLYPMKARFRGPERGVRGLAVLPFIISMRQSFDSDAETASKLVIR